MTQIYADEDEWCASREVQENTYISLICVICGPP